MNEPKPTEMQNPIQDNPYAVGHELLCSLLRLIVEAPRSQVLKFVLDRVMPRHLVRTEHVLILAVIQSRHLTGKPLTVSAIQEDIRVQEVGGYTQAVLNWLLRESSKAPVESEKVEALVKETLSACDERERRENRSRLTVAGPRGLRLQSIQLNCGRNVWADEVHYSRTYSGWLEGGPDLERTKQMIGEAKKRVLNRYGIETHLIEPEIDMSNPRYPTIPPVELAVRCWCNDPVRDPDFHGSHLAVVWFVDDAEFELKPLAYIIHDGIKDVAWNTLAEDFEW